MNEKLQDSFMYEHCDVPRGQSLAQWRTARAPRSRRRGSGVIAAVANLAPSVLTGRGNRSR